MNVILIKADELFGSIESPYVGKEFIIIESFILTDGVYHTIRCLDNRDVELTVSDDQIVATELAKKVG